MSSLGENNGSQNNIYGNIMKDLENFGIVTNENEEENISVKPTSRNNKSRVNNAQETVTEQPVIQETVTEQPVIQETVTEEPVIQETVTEQPVIQEIVTEEQPVIQEIVTEEQPVIQEIVTEEQPVIQETVTEEQPVIQEIVTEEQKEEEEQEAAAQEAEREEEVEETERVEAAVQESVNERDSRLDRIEQREREEVKPVEQRNNAVAVEQLNNHYESMPDSELFKEWENANEIKLFEKWESADNDQKIEKLKDAPVKFTTRDVLINVLKKRKLFPTRFIDRWEHDTGAYPDTLDPMFLEKLLRKREFADSLQKSWKPSSDPCEDDGTFEVTPVQRFVANFMSPKTPYMSALLFHGVGVGKTCAAIQIAEAWLDIFPKKEVVIVAPPTIQQGFFKTIFDINKVKIGQGNEPNTVSQCTGDKYMKLSNTLFEKDKARIERGVNKFIKRRYKVFGYISFANFVKDRLKGIPDSLSDDEKQQLKKDYIRRYFSGKLLIIDEAHNLRDLAETVADEDPDMPGGKAEKSDAAAGKQLTPYLRDVLQYSEGLKFVMLTATPMYNTYKEIIFVLNLLLMNDKKATLKESDVFDKTGNILEKGKDRLAEIATRYVSFMRGENPISFPIRLHPELPDDMTPRISNYPELNPNGREIPDRQKIFYERLPIVPIELKGECLRISEALTEQLPEGREGLSTFKLDKLIQAGNFIVPSINRNPDELINDFERQLEPDVLSSVFTKETYNNEVRFKGKPSIGAKWLAYDPANGINNLENYSPKFAFLLSRLRTCEGVVFAYSRFISAGALPMALALEANGYSPWGRRTGLLGDGIQITGGRQCALCPQREKNHTNNSHTFTPAYYGLLTGDKSISPRNEAIIQAEKAFDNVYGNKIKIVIGSQIASEGVDFRFIRETHVIDSWYHLNKTEQILGRAIRYLSHCALPKEKRNNTVYLYTATFPKDSEFGDRETADLYSYNLGFRKAVLVGNVTRIMKQSAVDCNLNNKAIVISGQPKEDLIDSQRKNRDGVDINDMPFTAVCDWIENCKYECKTIIDVEEIEKKHELDETTYDEFSYRWQIDKLKKRIRDLFKFQVFYKIEDLWQNLLDYPDIVVSNLLNEIVNNKSFIVINTNDQPGYIRFCNNYYVFQPIAYPDVNIPIAIRAAKYPIKQDIYIPTLTEYIEEEPVNDEQMRENKEQMKENVELLWNDISAWVNKLSESQEYFVPPQTLYNRIEDISQDDKDILDKYDNMISMIEWFHTSFNKYNRKNPEYFKQVILKFIWDKWFTYNEKVSLTFNPAVDVSICVNDTKYNLGRRVINRIVDPNNGQIKFLCDDGVLCSKPLIDTVNGEDPLARFKVNNTTVGKLYGFLVPKNGDIVFKTGEPPVLDMAVGRGKECATVTNMTGHIKKLVEIGEILQKFLGYDFDLKYEILIGRRSVRNSVNVCALLELFFRYLDIEKIQGKRWFLEPVIASYTGHKGFFRSKKI